MIQLISQNGHRAYGYKEYVVSTEEDLKELPIEGLISGSTAFVINTKTKYMFDASNSEYWVSIS